MSDEHLVRMANQIAANVPDQQRAAELTAAHLHTFWAPVMIEDLARLVDEHPDDVAPAVREALAILTPRRT